MVSGSTKNIIVTTTDAVVKQWFLFSRVSQEESTCNIRKQEKNPKWHSEKFQNTFSSLLIKLNPYIP